MRRYMVLYACGHKRRLQGETSDQCREERDYAARYLCLQCQKELGDLLPAEIPPAPRWLAESTFKVKDGQTVGWCVYPDCVARTYGTDHHYECARIYYVNNRRYLHAL